MEITGYETNSYIKRFIMRGNIKSVLPITNLHIQYI